MLEFFGHGAEKCVRARGHTEESLSLSFWLSGSDFPSGAGSHAVIGAVSALRLAHGVRFLLQSFVVGSRCQTRHQSASFAVLTFVVRYDTVLCGMV